jgi:Fe-S cluster assembly iron-binding protein IscA
MADTVTGPEVLQENEKRVVLKIVVESDGTEVQQYFLTLQHVP